jgi:ribonuclease BN (tRNA processing enzyme)
MSSLKPVAMRVRFLGSGDAFGSGGRYNACFLLEAAERRYLIDCGASSMIALRKFEIDPNTIDAIFISHFDIDHFGGAPLLVMEGHLLGERTRPLAIAGPVGLRHRFYQWIDLSLPSRLSSRQLRYELNLVELAPEHGVVETAGVQVRPFAVNHFGSDVGAPPLALRLQINGQVLAYTGDTDWVPSLVPCGRGADLLIAEAWHYKSNYRFHLDFVTLKQHLNEIGAKRVILTHMNQDMIDRAKNNSLGIEAAEDGLVIEV